MQTPLHLSCSICLRPSALVMHGYCWHDENLLFAEPMCDECMQESLGVGRVGLGYRWLPEFAVMFLAGCPLAVNAGFWGDFPVAE